MSFTKTYNIRLDRNKAITTAIWPECSTEKRDFFPRNIKLWNIKCLDIKCWDIKCWDIKCWDSLNTTTEPEKSLTLKLRTWVNPHSFLCTSCSVYVNRFTNGVISTVTGQKGVSLSVCLSICLSVCLSVIFSLSQQIHKWCDLNRNWRKRCPMFYWPSCSSIKCQYRHS